MAAAQPNQDDETLAARARQDRAAFAELYHRHVARIYRYIRARVGSTQDAEDLTAQTFAAALASISSFRASGSFAAWLTVLARNGVVNHYRAGRDELPLEAADTPRIDAHLDDVISRRLQLSAVRVALDHLPPDYAEAVRLRIFAELSTAETARALGKSEAAVKMLLHRALRDLRQRLNIQAADEVER